MECSAQQLSTFITNYLSRHPTASTNELARSLKIGRTKLIQHCKAVGIVLPKAMPRSIRASLSRKQNKLYDGWTINKPSLNGE